MYRFERKKTLLIKFSIYASMNFWMNYIFESTEPSLIKNIERKELIDKVCKRRIERGNHKSQVKNLIESIEELIQDLSEFEEKLNPELLEKIARVKIMIRQIEIGFECEDNVKRAMESEALKLARDLDLEEI